MAQRIHRIKNYNYSFDALAGGPGRLQLWGERGKIAEIGFVDDASTIPAPVVSADLTSATVFFKRGALSGLICLLRRKKNTSVTISDQGSVFVLNTYGLTDSLVVGSSCAPDLLAAKTRGIRTAMQRVVEYCGADALPEICPMTFHLQGDDVCSPYQSGMTGYFLRDATGLGHLCLYEAENENLAYPLTLENAELIQAQLLAVHEAMHGWFVGRLRNYRIEEPFCKLTSFVVTEFPGGPEYCSWFSGTPDDHPNVLMRYLCEIGMTTQRAAQVLKQLAQSASEIGRELSAVEFAGIVSSVLGRDAVPAFRLAGILP